MIGAGPRPGFNFGENSRREIFPQLDAPLIERVDPPDRGLDEDLVFVKGDQLPQNSRRQERRQQGIARSVAGTGLVGLARGSKGQGFALGKAVGHQTVVMIGHPVVGAGKRDEIAGDPARSLMEQLKKSVLAWRPRLSPDNRRRVMIERGAHDPNALAVALHLKLLEIGGEFAESLAVGRDAMGLGIEKAAVPNPQQAQQHGHVRLQGRATKMRVHRVHTPEHFAKGFGAHGQHQRETRRRGQGKTTAHPIPELKAINRVDAESPGGSRIRRCRDEMSSHRSLVAERPNQPVPRRAGVGQGFFGSEGL